MSPAAAYARALTRRANIHTAAFLAAYGAVMAAVMGIVRQ